MQASDWIALGAATVTAASVIISVVGLRYARKSARAAERQAVMAEIAKLGYEQISQQVSESMKKSPIVKRGRGKSELLRIESPGRAHVLSLLVGRFFAGSAMLAFLVSFVGALFVLSSLKKPSAASSVLIGVGSVLIAYVAIYLYACLLIRRWSWPRGWFVDTYNANSWEMGVMFAHSDFHTLPPDLQHQAIPYIKALYPVCVNLNIDPEYPGAKKIIESVREKLEELVNEDKLRVRKSLPPLPVLPADSK